MTDLFPATLPAHDPRPHSDSSCNCGLPIRAWGDGCQASTDDSPEACAEIAAAAGGGE
jgi:hypothetical protein